MPYAIFVESGGVTILMWFLRFVVFDLQESPKYLIAKGRDADAIKVLEHIAKRNGTTMTLTLGQLQAISNDMGDSGGVSTVQVIKKAMTSFSLFEPLVRLLVHPTNNIFQITRKASFLHQTFGDQHFIHHPDLGVCALLSLDWTGFWIEITRSA